MFQRFVKRAVKMAESVRRRARQPCAGVVGGLLAKDANMVNIPELDHLAQEKKVSNLSSITERNMSSCPA